MDRDTNTHELPKIKQKQDKVAVYLRPSYRGQAGGSQVVELPDQIQGYYGQLSQNLSQALKKNIRWKVKFSPKSFQY